MTIHAPLSGSPTSAQRITRASPGPGAQICWSGTQDAQASASQPCSEHVPLSQNAFRK